MTIETTQTDLYGFLTERLANAAPQDAHSIRLSSIKMACYTASAGHQPAQEKMVLACLEGGVLECVATAFVPRLQQIIVGVLAAVKPVTE
jgi:hypothetical protein